jgi:prepilin-type N-terminal cleavage/methylation domain-containing protein
MRRELARFDVRHSPRPGRSGFTLTELLVVIGITALLLLLVFLPMSQGFRWMQQGRAMVATQDTARSALEQISRDVAVATHIYDPPKRWDAGAGAWVEDRSRIDLLLPGRMLAETAEGSYVQYPLTPEGKVVTYFVGLRDAGRGYANDNIDEGEPGPNNLYWLFRAEFDPFHATDENGEPNPCYDQYDRYWRMREWLDWSGPNLGDFTGITDWPYGSTPADIAQGIKERRDYLRRRGQLVALVPIFDCDMVQASYNPTDGYTVLSGFTIQPSEVVNEIIQARDWQGYRDAEHSPPTVYASASGHWGGALDDGSVWSDDAARWVNSQDPWITVYGDDNGDGDREKVFDSADPNYRARTLTYDSEKGAVMFARHRSVSITYIPSAPPSYGDPTEQRIAVAFPGVQFRVMSGAREMAIERTLKVTAEKRNGSTLVSRISFYRGGAAIGTGQGYMSEPSDYHNDYTTMRCDLGPGNGDGVEETLIVKFNYNRLERLLAEAPQGDNLVFNFDFDVQDNTASDVVRVNYRTPTLMTITLSPRIYPAGSSFPETFQLTATVKPSNLRR